MLDLRSDALHLYHIFCTSYHSLIASSTPTSIPLFLGGSSYFLLIVLVVALLCTLPPPCVDTDSSDTGETFPGSTGWLERGIVVILSPGSGS